MIRYAGEAMDDVLYSIARNELMYNEYMAGCMMCEACNGDVYVTDEAKVFYGDNEVYRRVITCSCHSMMSDVNCETLHLYPMPYRDYMMCAHHGGTIYTKRSKHWKYKEA